MPRPVFLTGLLAIVLVAVLGSVALLRPPAQTGIAGSPVPSAIASPPTTGGSASPSANPTSGAVPPELLATWVAAPVTDTTKGQITGRKMAIAASGLELSGVSSKDPRPLRVLGSATGTTLTVSGTAGGLCPAGTTATMSWSLSPGGGILTLASGPDTSCADGISLLAGPWYRIGCTDPVDLCLGPLEAGTYASQYLEPRVRTGSWVARWGAMTYTVPAGWANFADYPYHFGLTNTFAAYAANGPVSELDVWAQPAAVAKPLACDTASADPAVGPSPAALATWLRSVKGLITSAPQSVTVGSYTGLRLRVSVSPTGGVTCPGAPGAAVELFLDRATGGQEEKGGWNLGILAGEQMELTFLDIGNGDVVLIAADATGDASTLQNLVVAGQPIVDSLQFH